MSSKYFIGSLLNRTILQQTSCIRKSYSTDKLQEALAAAANALGNAALEFNATLIDAKKAAENGAHKKEFDKAIAEAQKASQQAMVAAKREFDIAFEEAKKNIEKEIDKGKDVHNTTMKTMAQARKQFEKTVAETQKVVNDAMESGKRETNKIFEKQKKKK